MKYKISNAENLLNSVMEVSSFEEVQVWDAEATAELKSINQFLKNVSKESNNLKTQFDNAEKEFEYKNFFVKTYSTVTKKLKLTNKIQQLKKIEPTLQPYIEQLEYWIELTPDNIDEAKEMIAELKEGMKEYKLQKREFRVEMKEIRANSRRQNTNVGKVKLFTYSNSKLRQSQRQSIRQNKDAQLSPYEYAIQRLDYEIIKDEKLINWIQRIIRS